MAAKKRTPEEAWEALDAQARADEIDRFLATPTSEVEARLREAGIDPDKLRAEGEALARRLSAERKRLAWQVEAAEGLAREQARVAALRGRYATMPRAELRDRIAAALKDPRLAQPVTMMFRNRTAEEATDDELRAILEEIEALASRRDKP